MLGDGDGGGLHRAKHIRWNLPNKQPGLNNVPPLGPSWWFLQSAPPQPVRCPDPPGQIVIDNIFLGSPCCSVCRPLFWAHFSKPLATSLLNTGFSFPPRFEQSIRALADSFGFPKTNPSPPNSMANPIFNYRQPETFYSVIASPIDLDRTVHGTVREATWARSTREVPAHCSRPASTIINPIALLLKTHGHLINCYL